MTDRRPTVSVVIPTWNEADRIGCAIESAWASGADEVIVSDGGSIDGTCDIARSLNARLVVGCKGRAAQQNAGADLASGDYLLFLHADNALGTDCIDQLRTGVARDGLRCAAFAQRIEDDATIYRWLEWGNRVRVRTFRLAYGDQAITLQRSLFIELGKFPPQPLMEDVCLSRRLYRSGHRVHLLPGPVSVSARRWQRHGVIRQTLRNWLLLAAYYANVSPSRLAYFYRAHQS